MSHGIKWIMLLIKAPDEANTYNCFIQSLYVYFSLFENVLQLNCCHSHFFKSQTQNLYLSWSLAHLLTLIPILFHTTILSDTN